MAEVPPREWHPRHRLDRIEVHLDLSHPDGIGLTAWGRSDGKRTALWTYAEHFDEDHMGMAAHDAAAHILLAACQDLPTSPESLSRCLAGGTLWDEPELPWT